MSSKEKFRTYKAVFDESTLRVLFKLESEGYFKELLSPIKIGKESNIFSAVKEDDSFVILKIYRINNAEFKRMYTYIAADSRFEGLSNNRRKVIFAWAQREYRNLLTAHQAGVAVPLPHAVKANVLVMELIGTDSLVAPRLKEVESTNVQKFYLDVLKNLKKLYAAGYVHGDLSEFNILNFKETAYFIDFSHGTKLGSSLADSLLERDIKNLVSYFTKKGLKLKAEDVLMDVKNAI